MITKAIITLLHANAALAAIVGGRIYPNIIKTNSVYPAMYVSSDNMERILCDGKPKVFMGSVDIVVFADKYEQCHSAIAAVRSQLDDFYGLVAGVGISIESGQEVPDDYEDQKNHHVKSIEYRAVAQLHN